MAQEAPLSGRVEDFDEHRGYGTVAAQDGRRFFFHCTQIANGTRTIAVGTAVNFAIVPGRLGRYEAAAVAPCHQNPS